MNNTLVSVNKTKRSILYFVAFFFTLNYIIRLASISIFNHGIISSEAQINKFIIEHSDSVSKAAAWVEFWIFTEIQIIVTLLLTAFIGIRELYRWFSQGEGSAKISNKAYAIIVGFISFIAVAFIDVELFLDVFDKGRGSSLSLSVNFGFLAFNVTMSTCIVTAFALDSGTVQKNFDNFS